MRTSPKDMKRPHAEAELQDQSIGVRNRGILRPVKSGRLPRFSAHVLLVLLLLLLLGPGLVFTGHLLLRYASIERDRYALEALTTARQVAAVIDRDLNGLITTLGTLATSQPLRSGDFAGFYEQATVVSRLTDANIILRTPDGQQVVNTGYPWGAVLSPSHLAVDPDVIATKKPLVSDVFLERATNRPVVAVVLAVIIDGDFRYLLSLQAPTDRIAGLLTQDIVQPWIIGVGDRKGDYVTRVPGHTKFSGKPGIPSFLAQVKGMDGGLSRCPR